MNINYDYYRIFYYVAKYKNLTLAAEILHSNQPNLSRTIKLLEQELECQLLLRSNRGISLTPEGEKLYSHVKIAIEQLQSAEEELKMVTGLHQGTITVGASETALRLALLPVLSKFKKTHSNIRIRIRNHLTTQAIESVKNGSVDFSVIASSVDISKPLEARALMHFQDILIGGSEFFELSKKPISLSELKNHPIICLGEHTTTYHFYENFYRSHKLILRPELEAATTDQILPMVKCNLGLGFIPEIFAKNALDTGEICQIHLKETLPHREIYLVENKERPLTVAAEALKSMLISFDNQ